MRSECFLTISRNRRLFDAVLEPAREERLDERLDRGQGGPQLVAHVGDEVAPDALEGGEAGDVGEDPDGADLRPRRDRTGERRRCRTSARRRRRPARSRGTPPRARSAASNPATTVSFLTSSISGRPAGSRPRSPSIHRRASLQSRTCRPRSTTSRPSFIPPRIVSRSFFSPDSAWICSERARVMRLNADPSRPISSSRLVLDLQVPPARRDRVRRAAHLLDGKREAPGRQVAERRRRPRRMTKLSTPSVRL